MKLLDLYRCLGTLCLVSLGFSFHQENLLANCNEKNCLKENPYLPYKKLIKEKIVLEKLLVNLFLETDKNDNQSVASKNSFDIN